MKDESEITVANEVMHINLKRSSSQERDDLGFDSCSTIN
jgi:hypothetical protein